LGTSWYWVRVDLGTGWRWVRVELGTSWLGMSWFGYEFTEKLPSVTAHPSTASVPTSYYSMWHYNYFCTLKGLRG